MHAPLRALALATLALTPGCSGEEAEPLSAPPTAAGQPASAETAPTKADTPAEGVSLTFERAPLKIFEKDALSLVIAADGTVTNAEGKPMGVFGADGIYTNSRGEFGMQYKADGTLLRNDKTPFWGRLDADGNYVMKSGSWSFGPDGSFLINGLNIAQVRVEGVTPKTYSFAMAVMVAVIHPAAESIVY